MAKLIPAYGSRLTCAVRGHVWLDTVNEYQIGNENTGFSMARLYKRCIRCGKLHKTSPKPIEWDPEFRDEARRDPWL